MINLLFLLAGLLLGATGAWLWMRSRVALDGQSQRAVLEERLRAGQEEKAKADARLEELLLRTQALETQLGDLREEKGRVESELNEKRDRLGVLKTDYQVIATERESLLSSQSALQTTLEQERKQSAEKLELLQGARLELSNQFKVVAGEILEEKTRAFTQLNRENLDQILTPLQTKLQDFKNAVDEAYKTENDGRNALIGQVELLRKLNVTLCQDTQNLTQALKGDHELQGRFGEIVLDGLLSRCGLKPGLNYDVQHSATAEDGSRLRPDYIVHLDGTRDLIIDSKFSLPDHRLFTTDIDENEKSRLLNDYLKRARSHIEGLSGKKYQVLEGTRSPDFVIMFVPLEPAFTLAVATDPKLFDFAWDKNVLLVCPSTLLFVIRTVANLWRQQEIQKNAEKIADRGGALYDKLVAFVSDLKGVGTSLQTAQKNYEAAVKKFSEGNGNVIRQAEMLKAMGAKATKSLPPDWVVGASDDEHARVDAIENTP